MFKLSKVVAVAAVGLATLAPGLASACDNVIYGARPVGGPVVVERVGYRVHPEFRRWGRYERFERFEHGRRVYRRW